MRKILIYLVLTLTLPPAYSGHTAIEEEPLPLSQITSWAYQLQNINISQIADSPFELIVIDYSADGSDETKFTPEQISQIKNSGKKVISYISIGEAEDYRFYWQDEWLTNPPEWLGAENPDWEGNYKVRFWYPEWQNIIFSYIDTIHSQGFDGIYLDIIDAYYYWSEENPEEPLAASKMIQFVLNIRNHISGDDFFIIPQNGEFIIEDVSDNSKKMEYFNAIDGIGVEDVFFPGDVDENNPFNPDTERLEVLQEFLNNGKNVFSIEYLTESSLVQQYLTEVEKYNFVFYYTTRDLGHFYEPVYGDVNSDGAVNAYDAVLVLRHAVGLITLTPTQKWAGDVSGDSTVTALDAALILQHIVGLITQFPVDKIKSH